MITMDDYFKATPHERAFVDSLKPPIAHTHRKPVIVTAPMIFANRKRDAERTAPPTHRGEPRPILTELATVDARLAATGKDPNRA